MRAPSYKNAVLVVYMLGLFIQILDATVVNVALPTLAAEFTVEVTEIEWVVLGFLLSLAIGIPAAGWLGDRFGSKRVFLIALGVFTGASALCGAAGSVDQLVAFRILQGLGAGLITPIGSAMLYRAFPVHERARAAAAVVGVAVIAPALGPVVGGIIVQTTSWRWIFFVNIPIGAAAMVLGWLWLEESTEPTASRFDGPGLVLSGGGLAMLLYALSIAPDEGWTSPVVLLVGGGAVAAFAAMTVIELRIEQPMLQLRLFGERMFRTTNIAALFTYAGFLSQIFLFTLYLQVLRGSSPFEAGLTQSPQAVGVFLMSNLAGHRLYVAIGPRRLMTAGTAGTGLVTAIIALTDVDTPLWVLGTMMLARGLAMGLVFVSIQTATYARVSSADMANATSLFNTQRQAANAVGVAIVATVLAVLAPALGADDVTAAADGLHAYRAAFLVSAAMFVPGMIASSLIRDEDAAATRAAPPPAPPLPSAARS